MTVSDLEEHKEVSFNLRKKKGIWEDMTHLTSALVETTNSILAVAIPNNGLNPYKMVEMYKNYKPVVPDEFRSDELYAEPSAEVWAKVKTEKIDRAVFRAQLKVTKYSNDKERLESLALDKGHGKVVVGGHEGLN